MWVHHNFARDREREEQRTKGRTKKLFVLFSNFNWMTFSGQNMNHQENSSSEWMGEKDGRKGRSYRIGQVKWSMQLIILLFVPKCFDHLLDLVLSSPNENWTLPLMANFVLIPSPSIIGLSAFIFKNLRLFSFS